jgi:ferredoxin--NADP+ reductase
MKTAFCIAAFLASASAFAPVAKPTVSTAVQAQDFLEAEPYYDQSTVPVNVYKNKAPFTGKIVSKAYRWPQGHW